MRLETPPTNIAPVQRFRWSDYRVYPDTEYAYPSTPSTAALPSQGSEGPTVAVRTADLGGEHGVLFNRARRGEPGFL